MAEPWTWAKLREKAEAKYQNVSPSTFSSLWSVLISRRQDGLEMIDRFERYLKLLHAAIFTTPEYGYAIQPLPAADRGKIDGARMAFENQARADKKYRSLVYERAVIEKLNWFTVEELVDCDERNEDGAAVQRWRARDKKELFPKPEQDTIKAVVWNGALMFWHEPPAGQEPEEPPQ